MEIALRHRDVNTGEINDCDICFRTLAELRNKLRQMSIFALARRWSDDDVISNPVPIRRLQKRFLINGRVFRPFSNNVIKTKKVMRKLSPC